MVDSFSANLSPYLRLWKLKADRGMRHWKTKKKQKCKTACIIFCKLYKVNTWPIVPDLHKLLVLPKCTSKSLLFSYFLINKLIAAKTQKIHPHFFIDSKAWATPTLHTKVSKLLIHIQLIDKFRFIANFKGKSWHMLMIYTNNLTFNY